MTSLRVSAQASRRFLVQAFGLERRGGFADVASVVDRLEFVQEDSINVCGRIHDLILWARVPDYTPALLQTALYQSPRLLWEYYFPNLCVLPVRDIPYFRRAMMARQATPGHYHGLQDDEHAIAREVFGLLDTTGPLRTRGTGVAHGSAVSGWGTQTTRTARVIEKLWLHGRLAIERRENFERYFDRAERHLPELANSALPDPHDEAVYKTRKRLQARRLFRLKKADRELLGTEAFTPVHIEGDSKPWHILREDTNALQQAARVSSTSSDNSEVHFLAPLDPLVYDRERNRSVFHFDYTWEVYTPQAKRKWGYYVLPILHGERLIGRVDPKINRATQTLHIHSLTLEAGVEPSEIAASLARRLREYAAFLGATRIDFGTVESALLSRLE